MRKLVSLQFIEDITPIPGADKIETAHIGGWSVVVGKGEYYVGQQVFYFEIDSMLPLDRSYFAFLRERGVTEQNGIEYHRIKTAKLRGQISQGLIFPYEIMDKNPNYPDRSKVPYLDPDESVEKATEILEENNGDFSKYFGVVKYEPELPEGTLPFPGWISRTDETRIQSLEKKTIKQILAERENFIATEKLDGTSVTFWAKGEEEGVSLGVCGRNKGFAYTPHGQIWGIAQQKLIQGMSILDFLTRMVKNGAKTCVLQGEMVGGKVQNNPLGLPKRTVRLFNFFINGEQLPYSKIEANYPELLELWVPILDLKLPETVEEIVEQPDGVKSQMPGTDAQIEGIVWRHKLKTNFDNGERASFKAISNEYLLKHGG